jgi:hypothetical protein
MIYSLSLNEQISKSFRTIQKLYKGEEQHHAPHSFTLPAVVFPERRSWIRTPVLRQTNVTFEADIRHNMEEIVSAPELVLEFIPFCANYAIGGIRRVIVGLLRIEFHRIQFR